MWYVLLLAACVAGDQLLKWWVTAHLEMGQSAPLLPGVVQVPHNGQPIVLMNDAQTTGGYPRIACIIEADMYQLAQIPLGQPIHFVACSLEEALKARADRQRYLEQLAWRLHDDD